MAGLRGFCSYPIRPNKIYSVGHFAEVQCVGWKLHVSTGQVTRGARRRSLLWEYASGNRYKLAIERLCSCSVHLVIKISTFSERTNIFPTYSGKLEPNHDDGQHTNLRHYRQLLCFIESGTVKLVICWLICITTKTPTPSKVTFVVCQCVSLLKYLNFTQIKGADNIFWWLASIALLIVMWR